MKASRTFCLSILVASLLLAAGCGTVQQLDVTTGYNLASTQITVGLSIVFKTPPDGKALEKLKAAGAIQNRADLPLVWILPYYDWTNSLHAIAFLSALEEGATIKKYKL